MNPVEPKGQIIRFQWPWKFWKREGLLAFCLLVLIQAGCEPSHSDVSEELTRQFQASGRSFVDLEEVLPSPGKRCVSLVRTPIGSQLIQHWVLIGLKCPSRQLKRTMKSGYCCFSKGERLWNGWSTLGGTEILRIYHDNVFRGRKRFSSTLLIPPKATPVSFPKNDSERTHHVVSMTGACRQTDRFPASF